MTVEKLKSIQTVIVELKIKALLMYTKNNQYALLCYLTQFGINSSWLLIGHSEYTCQGLLLKYT